MKPTHFIQQIDDAQILAAIERAESASSGEVRLFIAHAPVVDPLGAARAQFEKLGMTRTRQRNGVLLYFAPKSQRFAILGDEGIDAKCGEGFWQEIVNAMSPQFARGEFTQAIVEAINRVGAVLAQHFPREPGDQNELPNQIERE
jgi:uncharacterized membrane protein